MCVCVNRRSVYAYMYEDASIFLLVCVCVSVCVCVCVNRRTVYIYMYVDTSIFVLICGSE